MMAKRDRIIEGPMKYLAPAIILTFLAVFFSIILTLVATRWAVAMAGLGIAFACLAVIHNPRSSGTWVTALILTLINAFIVLDFLFT